MIEFFLTIRAKPNSSKNRVGGSYGDALVVAVTAPAVDGKASEAIIRLLADALDLPKRAFRIKSGPRARTKIVAIDLTDLEMGQKRALEVRISSLMIENGAP
jgi:uncharacterized protein YggU (UPF0235/DUF167 family)